mmetsp:Transcript_33177/g.80589  ORF Transcript_33177/g.80589 Transcript_33177/m.80589 type:complete len:979 (-) Transcript_33177:295-3231(-)
MPTSYDSGINGGDTDYQRIHEDRKVKKSPEELNDEEEKLLAGTGESGLSSEEVARRFEQYGPNELPEKTDNILLKFLSYFWGPMPIMIWLAAAVTLAQCLYGKSEHWPDFGVLMGLQFINGTVAFFEEHNAGNAIAALKASLAPKANVKRNGEFRIVNARELVPGDLVVLQIGGVVPADCKLLGPRELQVDQAALTGESLPVTMRKGDVAKMGSTVKRGEMEAIVVKTGENTFFGRAAGMIGNVVQQGRFQKVLFNVMTFLMALASVLVVIILIVLLVDNGTDTDEVLDSIGTAVVLLIASIPIAMQVVATVTMAVGASLLASKKAIVARLSAIEELAGMHTLCSDKTGTLTLNQLQLDDPVMFDEGITAKRLIFLSALAAKRLDEGQDAIDTCIMNMALKETTKEAMHAYEQVEFIPFDPAIKRTEATLRHPKEGKFRVTKGAAPQILELCVDGKRKEHKVMQTVNNLADRGYRALGVAVTNKDDEFVFSGVLSLFDPPRHDTKRTIEKAQEMGAQVKMITGDHTAIAVETARRLGMGTTIHSVGAMKGEMPLPESKEEAKRRSRAESMQGTSPSNKPVLPYQAMAPADLEDIIISADGFAEVLPEDKYKIVEVLQASGQIVGMTGDGVNDAPALKKAEIGIAVEGATDAARAAADIVLTEPGLSVIIDAMIMSRKIFQRVRNYCIYRVAGTIQLIFFFFIAIFFDPSDYFSDTDEKNFRLPVLAVVFITLVNDACVLTISRDNVEASRDPQAWHLREVFLVSAVLGFSAVAASVFLLVSAFRAGDKADDADNLGCIFFKDCKATYGEAQSAVFLNLCISDIITVFSARTRGWFFGRRPATALMIAFLFAVAATSIVTTQADFGGMKTIGAHTMGITWVFAFGWFLVRDAFKIVAYALITHFKVVDREAYLRVVDTKPKETMGIKNIRKFSNDVRAAVRKTSAADEFFLGRDEHHQNHPVGDVEAAYEREGSVGGGY